MWELIIVFLNTRFSTPIKIRNHFKKVVLAKPVIPEEHVKILPANRIRVKIKEFAPSMKPKVQNFHANVLKALMEKPVI